MKRLLGALALAALVPASLSLAEPGEQDVDQAVYTHEPLPVAVATTPPVAQIANEPLNRHQQQALAQGRSLRPGVYRMRSLHSGLCAVISDTGANPPMETWDCNRDDGWQHAGFNNHWVVLPHPAGGYTLRGHPQRLRFEGGRPERLGEFGNCLTVARGVLIGAARIELRPCDVQNGDWNQAGVNDQRFFIHRESARTHWVSVAEVGDAPECITLRDNGRGGGTGVIRWQCNRTPDQMWEFEWMGPVTPGHEDSLLAEAGWYRTPSGHFNILAASGVDLTGPVYSSFDTANDTGEYCKKRCAELDQCKAWTWTGPGYVANSNDPPRCYWKSAVGEPVNRGPSAIGRLRSGIVRP